MVVTLTGENGFEIKKRLQAITAEFLRAHEEFALERLNGDEVSYERIQESLQSLPFLTSRRIVVLNSPSANKQFVNNIDNLLQYLSDTTDLIIVEPKLDKRSVYYKTLKKITDYREFNRLDENGLKHWLVDLAKEQDGNISLSDASFLIDRVGLNQQILGHELEKLLIYEANISRRSIELLTEPTPQSTIFELIESAFTKDIIKSINLFVEQREQKVEPAQIIAMLTWQLRILALIKVSGNRSVPDIASETKINPYVIRKSQSIASKLTTDKLKRLVADLLEIDTRSKRENIDLDEVLQNYLIQLSD